MRSGLFRCPKDRCEEAEEASGVSIVGFEGFKEVQRFGDRAVESSGVDKEGI
jgi:hypothetical protein